MAKSKYETAWGADLGELRAEIERWTGQGYDIVGSPFPAHGGHACLMALRPPSVTALMFPEEVRT